MGLDWIKNKPKLRALCEFIDKECQSHRRSSEFEIKLHYSGFLPSVDKTPWQAKGVWKLYNNIDDTIHWNYCIMENITISFYSEFYNLFPKLYSYPNILVQKCNGMGQ